MMAEEGGIKDYRTHISRFCTLRHRSHASAIGYSSSVCAPSDYQRHWGHKALPCSTMLKINIFDKAYYFLKLGISGKTGYSQDD